MDLTRYALHDLAAQVGTPFYLYDATILRKRYEEYRLGLRPRRVVTDDRFSRRSQALILLDAIARLPGVAPEWSSPQVLPGYPPSYR